MSSKLTLSVESEVVSRAKRYARSRGTSLSAMVESYLTAVSESPAVAQTPPILRSLRGVLRKGDIGDHKKYLASKYR